VTQSHFASDITKAVQNRVFLRNPNAAQYIRYVTAFLHPDRTNALQMPPHRIQNANIQGRSPSIQMYSLKLRRLKYTVLEKAECEAKRRRAARVSRLRIALSSAYNLGRWCLWLRIRPEHGGYGFSTCFCLWNTRYSLYHTWFFHKSWVQFCRN